MHDENLDALFGTVPIFTKVRDDNKARYMDGAKEKNCILMQDKIVGAGAEMESLITDKNATISAKVNKNGTESYPTYIVKD